MMEHPVFGATYSKELARFFQGWVGDFDKWWCEVNETRNTPRTDLIEKFHVKLKEKTISGPIEFFDIPDGTTLLDSVHFAVEKYLDPCGPQNSDLEQHKLGAAAKLTTELRGILVELCTDYLQADLFILDEFQRFRELTTKKNEIANRVLNQTDAKVLLLSATPFKAYISRAEQQQGDDNYGDFKSVLEYLWEKDVNPDSAEIHLLEYEEQRSNLEMAILDPTPENISRYGKPARDEIQRMLSQVICRTERATVARDHHLMVEDVQFNLSISVGDIQNYVLTDRFIKALDEDTPNQKLRINPIEYCKSAPWPLSFMHGYKIREVADKVLGEHSASRARNLLNAANYNKAAGMGPWLPRNSIDEYALDITREDGHTRLKGLVDNAIGSKSEGARMLWVPPSLPYYRLGGAFEEQPGFTKTLIFSSWALVPRMISTLLSYEVEKKTIANPQTKGEQEKQERRYFPKDSEDGSTTTRRAPFRQLAFSDDGSLNGHTFLLFPSKVLSDLWIPRGKADDDLNNILSQIESKCVDLLNGIEHENDEQSTRPDEKWYAVAALALDIEESSKQYRAWAYRALKNHSALKDTSSRSRQFEQALEIAFEPSKLGRKPDDLAKVLALQALGNPATVALRSLRYSPPTKKVGQLATHLDSALSVSNAFLSLFDKPESIAAVRLDKSPPAYWRQVITYCANGCLQSLLDEYIYQLSSQTDKEEDVLESLCSSISVTTASIKVDFPGENGSIEPKQMRAHYAVSFNQRLDSDSGQKRAVGLREIFNSPFRPFVLTSTSVGQEGLDFHAWCRRVVHWNLPSNPVDLEQREGRVNRFQSHSIRQQLAAKYGAQISNTNDEPERALWDRLFLIAEKNEKKNSESDLVPFWHLDDSKFPIQRMVPLTKFSREEKQFKLLTESLGLYRLAFGQPRQAELVEALALQKPHDEDINRIYTELLIKLSPILYAKTVNPPGIPGDSKP